ncbi:hypothetical protein [Haladaptatus salinisoli]|uniref:hypothetical protein n=1 Tax=Haladaptatus salinisoli TaxID=2884876 RepID=UPI001D0A6957|nr:hypothetical protein [Haladaptatus salinisoli]
MVGSRTATALAGLALSIVLTVVLWQYFGTPFVFVFLPFLPILFGRSRRPESRTCPECGFRTRNPEFTHCPRDGTPLD